MKPKVGILIFNEVEVLDFAGPFEVFAITEKNGEKSFDCFTVAEKREPISARNGLVVMPRYSMDDCPALDILLVPGGYGAEKIEVNNPRLLAWIVAVSRAARIVASVCTGAFLLAKAGIITDQRVTTHWMDLDDLERQYPALEVVRGVKYVDEGQVMTSAGISAGIELSFHIVEKELDRETAERTAHRMDYDWRP